MKIFPICTLIHVVFFLALLISIPYKFSLYETHSSLYRSSYTIDINVIFGSSSSLFTTKFFVCPPKNPQKCTFEVFQIDRNKHWPDQNDTIWNRKFRGRRIIYSVFGEFSIVLIWRLVQRFVVAAFFWLMTKIVMGEILWACFVCTWNRIHIGIQSRRGIRLWWVLFIYLFPKQACIAWIMCIDKKWNEDRMWAGN